LYAGGERERGEQDQRSRNQRCLRGSRSIGGHIVLLGAEFNGRELRPPGGRASFRVRVWCGSTQTKEQLGFLEAAPSQEHLFSLSWDSLDECRSGVKGSHFLNCSVFRWDDTHYSLVSGDSSGEKYFVVHAFDSNDLLIEATYENDNVYLLARKPANGTYRILPIDQNDVDEATRVRTCVTRNPIICIVETRQQLDTFVRAAADKRDGYITVGVISAAAR
jgi:hypothetical protein